MPSRRRSSLTGICFSWRLPSLTGLSATAATTSPASTAQKWVRSLSSSNSSPLSVSPSGWRKTASRSARAWAVERRANRRLKDEYGVLTAHLGPLRQTLDHLTDRFALRRVLAEIVESRVAPPIPAALRVNQARRRDLRKQHDQPVGVGELGKAGLLDQSVADSLPRLLAAMEHDMHAAARSVRAGLRHIHHA